MHNTVKFTAQMQEHKPVPCQSNETITAIRLLPGCWLSFAGVTGVKTVSYGGMKPAVPGTAFFCPIRGKNGFNNHTDKTPRYRKVIPYYRSLLESIQTESDSTFFFFLKKKVSSAT